MAAVVAEAVADALAVADAAAAAWTPSRGVATAPQTVRPLPWAMAMSVRASAVAMSAWLVARRRGGARRRIAKPSRCYVLSGPSRFACKCSARRPLLFATPSALESELG